MTVRRAWGLVLAWLAFVCVVFVVTMAFGQTTSTTVQTRTDWPAPVNAVAMPDPADPSHAIIVGWGEPPVAPLPPANLTGEALGCSAVRLTYEVDWPYNTTTAVYLDGAFVGAASDDTVGVDGLDHVEAEQLTRGITTWQLTSMSTRHGADYTSPLTAPVTVDLRQVCPLPGDCRLPYDDRVDLFDVLRAIDIVLGRTTAGLGCDADCTMTVDLFDVLADVDVVLGTRAVPADPCPEGVV